MENLNLLPEEFKPKGYIVNLAKTLKKISMISLLFFITAACIFLAVTFLISLRTRSSLDNQKKLSTEIKSMEKTEQKLVLIKDRLKKIDKILSESNASSGIFILNDVVNIFPEGVYLKDVNLGETISQITVTASSLSSMSKYLSSVISSPGYKQVILFSFEFNLTDGYVAELGLAR